MNAQQIVQFHRDHAAQVAAPLSCTDLTLAAAIEHLVWRAAQHKGPEPTIHDRLWTALQATRWPATNARDVIDDNLGIVVQPPKYDLVWLRSVESRLRAAITEAGFTPKAAKALTGATSEIINNVWQHAETTRPTLLAYCLQPGRVHLGIADLGIGVLKSLRTNPAYRALTTSMAALKKAMLVGVSRIPEEGRGYGFDTILRAVADQWGAVRLRTGQAILTFHGTTDLRHAATGYGVEFPGLQVVFTCGTIPTAASIVL